MIAYLDTSAAMKRLVEEPESPALAAYLRKVSRNGETEVVAGWLLHTELHCAVNRHPDEVSVETVSQVLDSLTLVDVTRGDLVTAGSLPGGLRSHDAIHLAVALRVGADTMIAYDEELLAAASGAGLAPQRPT